MNIEKLYRLNNKGEKVFYLPYSTGDSVRIGNASLNTVLSNKINKGDAPTLAEHRDLQARVDELSKIDIPSVVDTRLVSLIKAMPETFTILEEITTRFNDDKDAFNTVIASIASRATKASVRELYDYIDNHCYDKEEVDVKIKRLEDRIKELESKC